MNVRQFILAWLSALSILAAPVAAADSAHWPRPLSAYAANRDVCIVVYSRSDDQYLVHNMEQCQERLSPCSTFKVPNALIGLETGVLSGPDHRKAWDGTVHQREVLNQDHDLASAIRESVVWYFQAVALEIGAGRMQRELDAYGYGNRDISGGQDHFWLSSSLRLSALEQVRFMRSLDEGSLPADPAHQATVKSMMRQHQNLPADFTGELYGKTGSCSAPEGDHGWFAGFLQRGDAGYVFAVNVKGPGAYGQEARKIAVEVLHDLRQ